MTIPAWMSRTDDSPPPACSAGSGRKSFARKTADSLLGFFEGSLASGGYARRDGLLQSLDPRVKLIATLRWSFP